MLDKIKNNKNLKIALIIIVIIILLDQATKLLMTNIGEIKLIDNFLTLKISENTNGTYGVGSNSSFLYILTNIIVIAVVFKLLLSQNEFVDSKTRLFLSFIIAGSLSNTIDRIIFGYVKEFININNSITINLADIFMVLGWVAFIITFLIFTFTNKKKEEKIKESATVITDGKKETKTDNSDTKKEN